MVQQFCIGTKSNGKVKLSLDPMRLNQVLMRLVQRGPMLNDIFQKLNNAKYPFYRYKFWISQPEDSQEVIIPQKICLPIWQIQIEEIVIWRAPAEDMFQRS